MILSTAAVSSVPRAVPMPANAIATDRWLWKLLAFSAVLKLALVFAVRGHAPVLDEVAYLDLARGLVQTGEFEGTFRPPLYPAFMAAFLGSGLGTIGIIIAQVLISTQSSSFLDSFDPEEILADNFVLVVQPPDEPPPTPGLPLAIAEVIADHAR